MSLVFIEDQTGGITFNKMGRSVTNERLHFNLVRPLSLVQASISHFARLPFQFYWLVIFNGLTKICHFITFLLPFKALLLAVTDERTITLFRWDFSSKVLALAILIAAGVFFAGQWIFRAKYERILGRLFGYEAGDEEHVAEVTANADASTEKSLRIAVDFLSSSAIGIALIVATTVVLPWNFLPLLLLSVCYFGSLANGPSLDQTKRYDLSWHNNLFVFLSMASVLVLLAALGFANIHVGMLSGIFVFVATRQIFACFADISRAIFNYRNPVVPRFLRTATGTRSLPQYTVQIPPYLNAAQKSGWMEGIVSSAISAPVRLVSSKWRATGLTTLHSFEVEIEHGERGNHQSRQNYLLNVYMSKARETYNQELSFNVASQNNPLSLAMSGTKREAAYSTIVYDLKGAQQSDQAFFLASLSTILIGLWGTVPPRQSLLLGSHTDFLRTLDEPSIAVLKAVARNDLEIAELDYLMAELGRLKLIIASLPIGFHNPQINALTTMRAIDGSPKISMWGYVDVLPIGCQLWYLPAQANSVLDETVSSLRRRREDCQVLTVSNIRLAAATLGLTKCLAKGMLFEAIDCAGRIVVDLKDHR